MQNAKQLEAVYDQLKYSADGSAEKELERYMDSITAKSNALRESVKSIFIDSISSDSVKGILDFSKDLVDGLHTVINTFGLLPTTISAVVTGLTLLNSKFRQVAQDFMNCVTPIRALNTGLANLQSKWRANASALSTQITSTRNTANAFRQAGIAVNGVGLEMTKLYGKLVLAKLGIIATQVAMVALQATFTMGLSLALSLVIDKLIDLGGKLFSTKDYMEKCAEASKNLNNTLNGEGGDNKLIDKYEELNKKLEEGNLKEDEKKKINEEIIDVKNQLSDLDLKYQGVLDGHIEDYKEQLALLKEIRDEKLRDQAKEVDDKTESQSKIEKKYKELQNIMKYRQQYEESGKYGDYSGSLAKSQYENSINRYKELYTDIATYNANVKMMQDAHYATKKSLMDLTDEERNFFVSISESDDKTKESKEGIKVLEEALGGLQQKTEDTAEAFKNMSDEISASTDKISILKEFIEDFQENGTISSKLEDKIFKSGDTELIALLGDKNTALEKANQLLDAETKKREELKQTIIANAEAQTNATNTDVANTENANNTKLKSATDMLNDLKEVTGKTIDELAKQYGVDLTNKESVENQKGKLIMGMLNEMAEATGKTINELAQQYGVDLTNFNMFMNEKSKLVEDFIVLANRVNKVIENNGSTTDIALAASGNRVPLIDRQKPNYNPIHSSYNPVGTNYDKKTSNSKKSKQEKQDIEDTANRYQYLQDRLDTVNDALTLNKTLQEKAHGQEARNLINKEIALVEKEIEAQRRLLQAYKNRAWQLRLQIDSKGAWFDSEGNIGNYYELLEKYRKRYNSNKTDENKKAYDNMKKMLDEYNNLIRNSITTTQNEIKQALNEIKSIQEEKLNMVSSAEEKIGDIYKATAQKKVDTITEALNKEKELYQKQFDEEDKADERNDLQKELEDIDAQIQQAIISGDKQLANALKKQYAEKQAELNKTINQQQREEMTDRLDKEIDANEKKLEELLKPENLNKTINDAMKSGILNVLGEQKNLSQVTKDYVNDTVVGINSINKSYKELYDIIKDGKTLLSDIAGVNSSLGLYNVAKVSTHIPQANVKNRSVNLEFKTPLINIENADTTTLQQLYSMQDDIANAIYRKLESIQ